MLLLKIYLGFCLLTFLVIKIGIYETIQNAKRKYAKEIEDNGQNAKSSFLETLCVHIRMFIVCFIPLINLVLFWAILFNNSAVQNNAFDRIDKQLKNRNKQQ